MALEAAILENTAAVRELIAVLAHRQMDVVARLNTISIDQIDVSDSVKVVPTTVADVEPPKVAPRPTPAAAKPVEVQAAASSTTAPAAASAAVSYDDAKAAVLAVSKRLGREDALAILRKFGTEKLPEVDPSQFAAVVAACNQALGV